MAKRNNFIKRFFIFLFSEYQPICNHCDCFYSIADNKEICIWDHKLDYEAYKGLTVPQKGYCLDFKRKHG